MNLVLLTVIFVLALAAIALSMTIVISALHENKKGIKQVESQTIKKVQTKTNTLIRNAMKKAQKLLVQAELTGIKQVARTRHDTTKLEKKYEHELNDLFTQTIQKFMHDAQKVDADYAQFFKQTQEAIKKHMADNEQRIINQLDTLTGETEKSFKEVSAVSADRFEKMLIKEHEEMKARIREYEEVRKHHVDEHITEIVKETVKHVLGKTLSLNEHAELVYQALAEAKRKEFFKKA